jgi:hypothetical protein
MQAPHALFLVENPGCCNILHRAAKPNTGALATRQGEAWYLLEDRCSPPPLKCGSYSIYAIIEIEDPVGRVGRLRGNEAGWGRMRSHTNWNFSIRRAASAIYLE